MRQLSYNCIRAMAGKGALLACSLILDLTLPSVATAQTNAPAQPVISVSPTNLNFGLIAVGRSKDLTVLIENLGDGLLAGSASGKDSFSVISGGTYALTNHQSQAITIRYSPKSVGTNLQSVSFTGGGSMNVTVRGQAAIPPPPPMNLHIVGQ